MAELVVPVATPAATPAAGGRRTGTRPAWRRGLAGLRNRSLKTKLLLMMFSLLLLSVSSLFLLHLFSEREMLSEVRSYTGELSTAIEIAQEQPTSEGDPQVVLKAYAENLRKLGVKSVSIADASEEVKVSTDPKNVGKRLERTSRRKGPREYVVRGFLGDEPNPLGGQKTSTLTIPIVVGDRRVGYLAITRVLDDFSELAQQAFVSRLLTTLAVFAFGILLSLYLAFTFSRPLQTLTEAARQVAAGDLSVKVAAAGGDEIGSLTRTFNEMVARLREKRQIEERLHFAERSTAVGRLASAMAHEIRNPLNFINLSIDHLRTQLAPGDESKREDFDRILSSVKAEISRLNRLVGDFLAFGKPMRLDRRLCALPDIVRGVAALIEHTVKDRGIVLSVEAAPDLPQIVVDPELLKTCLLNLMINAADAMPDGGTLSVAVRRSNGGADALEITVIDTGRGMSPEDVRAAFEPYFSTKDAGLGLGLALTRKIIEDHGGGISLVSAPQQGTEVRIVLPLKAVAAVEPEPESVDAP